MNGTWMLLLVPIATVLVGFVTAYTNRNANIRSLRRDEDEERGQRIAELERRLDEAEAKHSTELREEQHQRRKCEAVIYALRGQILVLRGALQQAGIQLPPVENIPYE